MHVAALRAVGLIRLVNLKMPFSRFPFLTCSFMPQKIAGALFTSVVRMASALRS